MKRRRLEFEIAFVSYFVIAFVCGAAGLLIACGLGKIPDGLFDGWRIINAFLPLILAEVFDIAVNLSNSRYEFKRFTLWEALKKSLRSTVIMGAIWAMILLVEKNGVVGARFFFSITLVLFFAALTVFWYAVPKIVMRNFRTSDDASLVAIISTRKRAGDAVRHLQYDWTRRLIGIGIANAHFAVREGDAVNGVPVMADSDGILPWLQTQAVDEVFIFLEPDEVKSIIHIVHELMRMGIRVHIDLPEVEALNQNLKIIEKDGYVPAITRNLKFTTDEDVILTLNQPTMRIRSVMLKRLIDILGALVGLFFTGILFLFVAPAIKLDSPGPIFFGQMRIGRNGRRFRMYKFRSMYQDAEARKKELMSQNEMSGLMFKMKDDPRITKVGKFIRKTSIDEFPQFWNVLKGDMSLVGTRPPTENEFQNYNSYHKRRLAMRPGITGMWQVSGRSDITDFEEVVRLDCEYIDNWSMRLDMKILLETVGQVFRHKGAS